MELVSLAAGCVLSVAEVEIEPVDTGWKESAHVEVLSQGRCPHVDVLLPPGVSIERLKAKVRLGDGTRHRVDADRQRRRTRDVEGHGALRLYTPELLLGDRIEIDLVRAHPAADWTWQPGSGGVTRFASLASSVLPGAPPDGVSEDDDGFWVSEPPADLALTLPHPSPAPSPSVPSAIGPEDPPVQAVRSLVLNVNGRDPMTALYPGGGSTLGVTWAIDWPALERERAWVLPIPTAASDVVVEVSDGGSWVRRDDSVLLVAEADATPTHTVSWVEPDAPVYGGPVTLPHAEIRQDVSMDGARIRWQEEPWGRAWWVGSLGMRRLVPDRSQLIRALDRRFGRAAIPEPAVPGELRGASGSWDALVALEAALETRAGVADLPLQPLFPRRLVKARRTGALTSVEAALILWLQALQLRVPAAWAVVHPADLGEGWHTSAAGYTEGLVAYQLDGETRWSDPGCAVCGPFEIRSELEEASMISPIGNHTRAATEGRMSVRDQNGQRRVELEGPAALRLRQALSRVRPADREAWLASRFGGPDATLVELEGVENLGGPLHLVVAGKTPPPPFELDAPLPADSVPGRNESWWGWMGERVWSYEAGSAAHSGQHVHAGPLCWTTETEGEMRIERLTVRSRRVDPELTESVLGAAVRLDSFD
jgi:hypothetical protein